jgi:hypothetical protein
MEDIKEKLDKGWLQTWMMFEVLAIKEDVTKQSLENLINKLEKDERVKIFKKKFSETEKVEKPMKNIDTGYSQVCEIELLTKSFDNLVQLVIEYGPSAVEILKPEKFKIELGEAQGILNTIAEMMHRFASAGIGGVVLVNK